MIGRTLGDEADLMVKSLIYLAVGTEGYKS